MPVVTLSLPKGEEVNVQLTSSCFGRLSMTTTFLVARSARCHPERVEG